MRRTAKSRAEPHSEAPPEAPPASDENARPNGQASHDNRARPNGGADGEDAHDNGAAPNGPAAGDQTKNKQRAKGKAKRKKKHKTTEQPKTVSAGLQMMETGLHNLETDIESGKSKPVWVCDHIEALGFASDDADTWSLVTEFTDLRNRKHTTLLLRSSFAAARGDQVVKPLLEEGFRISSSKAAPALVRKYLMERNPEKKYALLSKPGWYEGSVFLLNNQVFGDTSKTPVIQRQDRTSPFRVMGTLEDWNAAIGQHAQGNPRLQLGIGLAFAAPLINLIGGESGVFHLRSPSRRGKSTILRVAGSVVGGRPTDLGYADSWNMTVNAGELACASHNDLLLCLDELKLVDPRHAGNLAYIIASGSGKGRMDKSLTAAPTLSWHVLALSSGEISLETHVTSALPDGGLYGGMFVRFVEVPEPTSAFGMFDQVPNEWSRQAGKSAEDPARQFAEDLSRRSRQCYGSPIRAYLAEIVPHRDQYAKLTIDLIQEFVRRSASDTRSSEIVNVAQRFGLAVAGGVIAIRLKILNWNEDQYIEGQLALFREWRDVRGSDAPADEDRAVRQVRSLVETHGARFVDPNVDPNSDFPIPNDEKNDEENGDRVDNKESPAGGYVTPNQLGYRKRMIIDGAEETIYLVRPEKWKSEFCHGLDANFVARTLHKRGHLYTDRDRNPDDAKGYQYSSKMPGFSRTQHFYAIRETILE